MSISVSRIPMNPTSIMTAVHATPPTLESKIKRWVELDNRIKETADAVKDIRTEKYVINDEIIELIEEKQLGKATVNISDGKLKFVTAKHTAPLTLNSSQVEQIMTYIKKNRETKTTTEIKRLYNEKPSSATKPGDDADDTE